MYKQNDAQQEEATRIISRFIAEADYAQLPATITEKVKHSVLDTLGIIMPASVLMPDLKAAIDLRIEAGGKAESTVLACGVKLPCWEAAFANGVRAHALDYADGHLEAVFRIGVSVSRRPSPSRRGSVESAAGNSSPPSRRGEEILCRLGVAVARRRLTIRPLACRHRSGEFRGDGLGSQDPGVEHGPDRQGLRHRLPANRGHRDYDSARLQYPGNVCRFRKSDGRPCRPDGSAGHPGAARAAWSPARTVCSPSIYQGRYDREALIGPVGVPIRGDRTSASSPGPPARSPIPTSMPC